MVGNQTDRDQAAGELEATERMRVIVADDDPFARRMIKESLQRAGVVVVAEAPDGRQAVELALFYRPDVVLMDVVMPERDGITATRQIVQAVPDQLVVMLTSSDEDEMGFVGLWAICPRTSTSTCCRKRSTAPSRARRRSRGVSR